MTLGPSLGLSEWRKGQSALATNPGSRSVQTARPSSRTREVGGTGAPIRKEQIERNDERSS